MAKHYHYRRYIRNPIPKPYTPQPRDNALLERLQEYGRLDTYQLLALARPFGLRNLRRRLQYMFHTGLIDRRRHDPGPIVYSISDKGKETLTRPGNELPKKRARITEYNKRVGSEHIDHTLMVSRFHVALSIALEPLKNTELVEWRNESPSLKAVVKVNGYRHVVVPDGFFTIKHKGKLLHFFLEADRSTMTRKRYAAKLRAYWQWWNQGGHLRFGASHFRVLTLTPSEQRKENLRALAHQADNRKRGSSMFLFASERDKEKNENFPLESPHSILSPVWQCGTWTGSRMCDQRHGLLE